MDIDPVKTTFNPGFPYRYQKKQLWYINCWMQKEER